MLSLRPYQVQSAERTLARLLSHSGHMLCLDPGLGKTAIASNVLASLFNFAGADRVLITAPPRVLSHWAKEIPRFGDPDIPVHLLTGSATQRLNVLRDAKTGVFLISHNLVAWLARLKALVLAFDMLVIDESSKMRNWSAQISKASRALSREARYRLLLTGSPAPNTPNELFPQVFLADPNTPLGKNVTDYRQRFTRKGGFKDYEYIFIAELLPVLQRITDPWITRQSNTILTGFPRTLVNTVPVTLPPDAMKVYKEIEDQLYTALTGDPLYVESAYNMLRQMSSGSFYDNEHKPQTLHTAKIETLVDLVDEIDDRVIIAYQFKHELPALQKAFPRAITTKELNKFSTARVLLAQSQSISHGVDGLQEHSHTLIFYTLTDSPEVFEQLIARLARSGQKSPTVIVHILSATNTVDRLVQMRLDRKNTLQAAMLEYFERRT